MASEARGNGTPQAAAVPNSFGAVKANISRSGCMQVGTHKRLTRPLKEQYSAPGSSVTPLIRSVLNFHTTDLANSQRFAWSRCPNPFHLNSIRYSALGLSVS